MKSRTVAKHKSGGDRRRLTGLFSSGDAAERAYQACIDRGHAVADVNVVVSEGTRSKLLQAQEGIKSALASHKTEGGELGGPGGGRVGILVTIFAAVGAAVALPATGFVAGPIAVALTAAGAAGAAAGLITALSDWGIPAERVRQYEAAIRAGDILLMVEARSTDEAGQIADEWKNLGGKDIFYG
jgi:hypothetical protein